MRRIRTKRIPLYWVELEPSVYNRLRALSIDSRRTESELLGMAVRLLATAVARTPSLKLPGRTEKPKPKDQRTPVPAIAGSVKTIVNKIRRRKP